MRGEAFKNPFTKELERTAELLMPDEMVSKRIFGSIMLAVGSVSALPLVRVASSKGPGRKGD